MAVILRYSTEFGSFGANYVKVVEDSLDPYCLRHVVQRTLVCFLPSNIQLMIIFAEVTENE